MDIKKPHQGEASLDEDGVLKLFGSLQRFGVLRSNGEQNYTPGAA
jgi:hypothetical protein